MNFDLPSKTVFYSIEKAIKTYRKYAQQHLSKSYRDLTVDQALILQFLYQDENLSQVDIAKLLFKENASITRMIESMVSKKYLIRKNDLSDRRKSNLEITAKGVNSMDQIKDIILSNRKKALEGISTNELEQLERILNKITKNCKTKI